jgi:hypothetical protein
LTANVSLYLSSEGAAADWRRSRQFRNRFSFRERGPFPWSKVNPKALAISFPTFVEGDSLRPSKDGWRRRRVFIDPSSRLEEFHCSGVGSGNSIAIFNAANLTGDFIRFIFKFQKLILKIPMG